LKKRPVTQVADSVIFWANSHSEVNQYLDVEEQRHKSSELNAKLVFSEANTVKGRKKAQDYNFRNCVAITQRVRLASRVEVN
jgi:hypothetical protein